MIVKPVGRRLRILIYARYSTEDQNPSSIEDQIAYCKEFLKGNGINITDAEIIVLSDAEMSGELVSRPGIDRARELIAKRWPDVYISEDCGRLFRHETACGEHLETAVDLGIRYIAINDDVDTAEEDWDDRLHEAMRHHARANKYTSKRIKRAFEGLWRTGAAIGLLRPGYKRRPSEPATERTPEEGPFFDELDDKWMPVIYEAYERIARKEPAWLVGQWLTEQGLPKCTNATSNVWTDKNVIALIRRTVYRGVETYRSTIAKKEYKSGKHKQERNTPDQVLTRDMPHLRIVPDWLWYAANQAIDERMLGEPGPTGLDHPLARISRDSRGPLSGLFVCGVCGGKMYKEGQVQAAYRSCYRCSMAPNGSCWNKATALPALVHERIGQAIIEKLLSLEGVLDAFVEHVKDLHQDDQPRLAHRAKVAAEIKDGQMVCQRLLDAIEQGKEAAPILLERLAQRQKELACSKAELERLDTQPASTSPPTKREILEKIEAISKKLVAMDREAGVWLKELVSPIRAVPHQQFGGNKVVLRAKFELRLAALLPDQVLAALQGVCDGPLANRLDTIPMTVDLFEPSSGPKHFAQALKLSRAGWILEQISKELGIAKRQAHVAVQYGRDLEAAGLTDPFIELKELPPAASRWRTDPRRKKGA